MKKTPLETFNTIPAQPGFFCLSMSEDAEGKPVADRDPIIAWITRITLESSDNPHDPSVYGELIPVTPWGVPSIDEQHFILSPDGRVTEPESTRWESEASWLKEQINTPASRG